MCESLAKKFTPIKLINLKNHPDISEAWVQKVLFEHPSLLGLGKIDARDKERVQPSGGRLDLLYQDEDGKTRYEVEVQLGATDETHIIRTIEYWDLERKRYPQYDHIGVIVAEEITARFFNVISLFNSNIPLIALKLTAVENQDGSLGLLFTKVLDLAPTSLEEDDAPAENLGRGYWVDRSSEEVLRLADSILNLVKEIEPRADLSYTKHYLGIWVDGKANNFVVCHLRQNFCYVNIKLDRSPEIDELIQQSVFNEADYLIRDRRYRFRVDAQTPKEGFALLKELLARAYRA